MAIDELCGETLGGRYRVLERLGSGGFGAVYSAEHLFTGRRFAVKVLLPALGADPRVSERFLREATTTATIDHENIVGIVDVGRTPAGALFFSMDLLRGETLESRLARRTRLSWSEARELLLQMCEGVRAAHAHDIAHRDLKPANIYLVPRARGPEHVKILDFGIAKLLRPADTHREKLTDHHEILGTPLYMAPEQIAGDPIDIRVDIHALGVLLFEMLTGRRPFAGNNQMELMARILRDDRPRLASAAPDLEFPEPLEDVVATAMARDPADRYADVSAMLAAIDELPDVPPATATLAPRGLPTDVEPLAETAVAAHSTSAVAPESPSSGAITHQPRLAQTVPARSRTLRILPALLGLVLCLLGGGIYILATSTPPEDPTAAAPPAIIYHACQIKITGDTPGLEGLKITDAWIKLTTGETTTVKVVGGRELVFRCLDDTSAGTLVVRFEDRVDHEWPDILLYADREIELPIAESRVVLPINAGSRKPKAAASLPPELPTCGASGPLDACRSRCELALDPESCFTAGVLTQSASSDPRSITEADALFGTACNLKHARACNSLAANLDRGREKRGRFAADALKTYDIACHLDDLWGCFNAAMTRMVEPATRTEGWSALLRTCERGHALACNAVGVAHRKGEYGQPRNNEQAARWFARACDMDASPDSFHFKGCGNLAELLAAEEREPVRVRTLAESTCRPKFRDECNNPTFGQAYSERCGQVAAQACLLLTHYLQEGLGGPVDRRRARKLTTSTIRYRGEAAY